MFCFLTRCAACSKCFLASNKLRYHIRRTHLTNDGPLRCTVCNKLFKSQRLLATHQKSHIRIDCPYCKRVISAANYEAHVKMSHIASAKKGESSKAPVNKRPNNPPPPVISIAKRPKSSLSQVKYFGRFFDKFHLLRFATKLICLLSFRCFIRIKYYS